MPKIKQRKENCLTKTPGENWDTYEPHDLTEISIVNSIFRNSEGLDYLEVVRRLARYHFRLVACLILIDVMKRTPDQGEQPGSSEFLMVLEESLSCNPPAIDKYMRRPEPTQTIAQCHVLQNSDRWKQTPFSEWALSQQPSSPPSGRKIVFDSLRAQKMLNDRDLVDVVDLIFDHYLDDQPEIHHAKLLDPLRRWARRGGIVMQQSSPSRNSGPSKQGCSSPRPQSANVETTYTVFRKSDGEKLFKFRNSEIEGWLRTVRNHVDSQYEVSDYFLDMLIYSMCKLHHCLVVLGAQGPEGSALAATNSQMLPAHGSHSGGGASQTSTTSRRTSSSDKAGS